MAETILTDRSARPRIILNDDGTLSFIGGTSVPVGGSPSLFADGTAPLPSIAFASEPSLGLRRLSAAMIGLEGGLTVSGALVAPGIGIATNLSRLRFSTFLGNDIVFNGSRFEFSNTNTTIGALIKVDATPTIGSGFGAGAAIVAGSTPWAGSVDTGAISASGVVLFNGTAFPVLPHLIAWNRTTGLAVKAVVTASQVTLSPATGNFAANDIVTWIAIGARA